MDNSPFNDLPAELRLSIYEFALTQDEPIPFTIENPSLETKAPLLNTCKQIRNEAFKIFLKNNTFNLQIRPFVWETDLNYREKVAKLVDDLIPYADGKLLKLLEVTFPMIEDKRTLMWRTEIKFSWAKIFKDMRPKLRGVVLKAIFAFFEPDGERRQFEVDIHGSDFWAMKEVIRREKDRLSSRYSPTGTMSHLARRLGYFKIMRDRGYVIVIARGIVEYLELKESG